MSDCSTNAFKAKAQKTCGNCNHGFRALVTCWEENPQGRHHAQNEPACPQWSERRPQRMCSCNKSRGYDALLERYEQLEKVAKSLLGIAHGAAEEIMFPSRELVAKQRRKLEALGVSLDD